MEPAHQRFCRTQDRDVRSDIELRLVEDLELVVGDRGREIFDQLFGIKFPFMQVVIIDADHLREVVFDGVGSGLGMVKTTLDAQALVDIGIDTHTKTHTVVGDLFARQTLGCRLEDVLVIFPMRAIDKEGICFLTADDTAFDSDEFPDTFTDPLQHFIAIGIAIAFIDHMEVVDIDDDRIHIGVLVELVVLLGVAIEVFLVVKVGQRIPFRGKDDIPIFGKFDRL